MWERSGARAFQCGPRQPQKFATGKLALFGHWQLIGAVRAKVAKIWANCDGLLFGSRTLILLMNKESDHLCVCVCGLAQARPYTLWPKHGISYAHLVTTLFTNDTPRMGVLSQMGFFFGRSHSWFSKFSAFAWWFFVLQFFVSFRNSSSACVCTIALFAHVFYWKAIECAVPLLFTGKWILGHSSDLSMLCRRWNVLSHANHCSITKSAFCYRLVFMLISAFMLWIVQRSFHSARSNLCIITVSETWFSASSWQQYRERESKNRVGKKTRKFNFDVCVCVCVCFV